MEPDQIPVLPPEIQRLEANKRAFDLPVLQLPSYDQIGKAKDMVFDREGDTLTPKKPTFQEELQERARKMQDVPDQMNPIGEYSRAQSEGFANPLLPYDPTVDMNEVYARYDPTTWADVAAKTWDTTVLNSWSGMKNIWYGLKEGITEGRLSAIYDNSYSKELAEMTLNMEKMNPMRFTQEEQGTTSAWLKQVLPSLGYVAAGAMEIAAQHALLTLGGAAIGAVSGEGVGAVPGAVAGNAAAYAKDAQTVATVLTNVGRASRAVSSLATANKIKTAGQMFGRGLLATNGEAALMGQLAASRSLEEQKAEHFKSTGQYLSGDALKQAEDDASNTAATTYALNWPLLAAGEIYMFGNLLRGKAVPQVVDKLAFKIDKATGKAKMTSPGMKVAGEFLGNAAVQGNEEVFQSVIEDASVNYFLQKKENRDNYLQSFGESAYKRAMSGEAMGDFMAGAVIGAIPGAVSLTGYSKVKANSQQAVDLYNSSTEIYFNRLGDNLKTNDRLREALATGDNQTAREEYRNHTVQLVNTLTRSGGTQAFSETLDALSDMDNAEFRKYTGLALNEEEQAKVLRDTTAEFKVAADFRKQVDTAYQVNPFEAESWFQRQINKSRKGFDVDKSAAAEVWDVFKSSLTANLIKYGDVGQQRQEIESIGSQASPEFMAITGSDPEAVIANKKALLESRVAATLPGWQKDKALLDKINSRTDPREQYQEILNAADKDTPGIKEMVLWHNRELQQEQLLWKEVQRLNTPAGQRKEIKKIIDWKNWYDAQITETAPAPTAPVPTQTVAGPVATETVPDPVVTDPAITPDTQDTTTEDTVLPQAEPTPQAGVPVAEPVAEVQPIEAPIAEPILTETIIPEETLTFTPDMTEVDVDALDSLYGEGKGEDYVPEALAPSVRETPEAKPNIQVDAIDTELPEDIQVDQTAIPEAVAQMEEGDVIVPEENGVEVLHQGKPVKRITKSEDKVKVETNSGESVEIPPSDLPLLITEKAQESPVTDVANFIAQNGLSAEKATTLRSLVANNYVEIVCR